MSSIKEVYDILHKKKIVSRYLLLAISLFVSAIMYNLLQLPTHIISGGSGGIAIITEHIFGWEPSTVIFLISLTLLIISFFVLGIEKTAASIVATFLYPYFVKITSVLVTYIRIDTSDLILISIFVGVIGGLTSGVSYKIGFNNGGLGILNQMLYKVKRWSLSRTNLIMNTVIVLTGGIYFGWTMVMYSCIVLYINSIVTDYVILGVSSTKSFLIMTSEEEQVKDYILNKLHYGVTEYKVKGGYDGKKKEAIMTVIATRDYYKLTKGVRQIDNTAFFVVTDAYDSSIKKEGIETK